MALGKATLYRKHVTPIGPQNANNLTFQTPDEFDPESLEVYLSGLHLDPVKDFIITNVNEFQIVLAPNDPNRLNKPPLQYEPFSISYELACS